METIIIVTILGRAQISMELIGSAKFRKREPENKTGGTDFACLTLARHPYYLRAHSNPALVAIVRMLSVDFIYNRN